MDKTWNVDVAYATRLIYLALSHEEQVLSGRKYRNIYTKEVRHVISCRFDFVRINGLKGKISATQFIEDWVLV